MLGLLAFAWMSSAFAAPPANQRQQLPARASEARPSLDLRAPATAMLVADKTSEASAVHRQTLGERPDFEVSSSEATHAPTPGSLEAFGQRFRREGLPVARLWENKSALVHVGLNQKGKPGLWIVQKVH
jgi:hypothetical protein